MIQPVVGDDEDDNADKEEKAKDVQRGGRAKRERMKEKAKGRTSGCCFISILILVLVLVLVLVILTFVVISRAMAMTLPTRIADYDYSGVLCLAVVGGPGPYVM